MLQKVRMQLASDDFAPSCVALINNYLADATFDDRKLKIESAKVQEEQKRQTIAYEQEMTKRQAEY